MDHENEIWLNLEDFPKHQVSSHGRIRNKRNGYILKPFADRYGYLRLSIGNTDNVYIHKLVCKTFYGDPEEPNMQVNHIDSNRKNNHVLNLEWDTPSRNIRWGVLHGNIDPHKGPRRAAEVNPKAVRIVDLDKTFGSVKECAEYLGVAPTNVSRVLRGERRGQRLHGHILEYA